jgi:hypothetical protein
MGCDIEVCPDLIADSGFLEKLAEIKALNDEIGGHLGR